MLKNEIHVVEYSMTQQRKWSHDLQHSKSPITELDEPDQPIGYVKP